MRTSHTFLAAISCAATLNAQTTGLDFTADDCDGVSHHLFADLDAGYAVIIDLVMMGCQPCVTASNGILNNVIPLTGDPARVKFYSIGFTNSITCAQMMNWASTNGFSHPVFAGMSAQTTYYGGMGMPTIIVLGGTSHTVYYSELGYSHSDDPALIQALNEALGVAAVNEHGLEQVGIGPNPASDLLSITGRWSSARVLDVHGREMFATEPDGGQLDVSALPAGMYVLRLSATDGREGMARFEKR